MTADPTSEDSFFSAICIDKCCDPWWGIVSYSLKKENGLSGLDRFRIDLLSSIRAREKRIRENYVTNERPPRYLFEKPDRYNVSLEKIDVSGSAIIMTLRAMFAFRCLFLSPENWLATYTPPLTQL